MSDHEIPLAIGLLKGISCVSSLYNSGLLLFTTLSSNYCTVITGEKNTVRFGSKLILEVYDRYIIHVRP
jgi:hypothetical protein